MNEYILIFIIINLKFTHKMESTGSTTSKTEKKENSIPKDHFKFLPSINEQGLGEKNNRKKL